MTTRALALAATLLFLPPAAHAACTNFGPAALTIQYVNAAGTVIGTKCYIASDADMANVEAAYGAALGGTPTVVQELVAMTNSWVEYSKHLTVLYLNSQATSGIAAPAIQ